VVEEPDAERFRDGDPDAVRAVYRAYGGLVFGIAYKMLGDRGLAEEASQQTFVQAWRGARAFDPTRELGPWLATIARRVAIDIHRREARRTHDHLDDVDPGHPAVVTLPPSTDTAFEVAEVRAALADLSTDEQQVVRLQYLEGLTQAEVSERLGVPLGTVKSRSFRAYRHLATRLGHLREGTDANQDDVGHVHARGEANR
jgi:RNA polymerase sigma-70 factor (ECF subfamily)